MECRALTRTLRSFRSVQVSSKKRRLLKTAFQLSSFPAFRRLRAIRLIMGCIRCLHVQRQRMLNTYNVTVKPRFRKIVRMAVTSDALYRKPSAAWTSALAAWLNEVSDVSKK
jgi:hypothetical protein